LNNRAFLEVLAFTGNQTNHLAIASAMLYYLSYGNANLRMNMKAELEPKAIQK